MTWWLSLDLTAEDLLEIREIKSRNEKNWNQFERYTVDLIIADIAGTEPPPRPIPKIPTVKTMDTMSYFDIIKLLEENGARVENMSGGNGERINFDVVFSSRNTTVLPIIQSLINHYREVEINLSTWEELEDYTATKCQDNILRVHLPKAC